MEMDDFLVWGCDEDSSSFSIHVPIDGQPATVGNGVMVALAAASRSQVQAIHTTALSLGGTDEGAPGPRGDGGFFAAYFRDLDGNKLNAHCMESAE